MGRRGIALTLTGIVGATAAAGVYFTRTGTAPRKGETTAPAAATADATPTLGQLAEGLRRSDNNALANLWQRLSDEKDQQGKEKPKTALTDAQAKEWIEVLKGLRHGYGRIDGSVARASAVVSASKILDRFTVEPAPACWSEALAPTRDVVLSGAMDTDPSIRAAALGEVARMWSWTPGRTPMPVEEQALAEWKDSLHAPVVRRLGDADPKVRLAAVACLGMNPIDSLAAPAVAYADDSRSSEVRRQVLVSLGNRPGILTDEMVLKRLHDEEPAIPILAEVILRARGLNKDHIFLGKLITSPRPEHRASVIPMLLERNDIDPVVWLVQLSHDPDEKVRVQAAQALGGKDTPEARRRLREMTNEDASAAVRDVASKIYTKLTTASLPPLPGSPRLNPRAN